jgi:hypothetical protein
MRCAVLVAMLASIVVASPRAARANGGNTHVWISLHAIDHLPEGRLKQMLSRPELRSALDRVEVVDSTGKSYALTADTQWGTAVGNVVKIRAAEDWAAGETFTVTVKPGLDSSMAFRWRHRFASRSRRRRAILARRRAILRRTSASPTWAACPTPAAARRAAVDAAPRCSPAWSASCCSADAASGELVSPRSGMR